MWTGSTSLRFCEHRNEHSSSVNVEKFLDQMSKCQLLKENFSPESLLN